MKNFPKSVCVAAVMTVLAVPVEVLGQTTPDYDLPPVNYTKSKDNNVITRLQAASLDRGMRVCKCCMGLVERKWTVPR